MEENLYASPQSKNPKDHGVRWLAHNETEHRGQNGLFIKSSIIAACLAGSSLISLLLSLFGGRLAYYPGSPTDEAVLYSFVYGLALSQFITLFFCKSRPNDLFTTAFAHIALKSLYAIIPIWLVVAWGGSEVVDRFVVFPYEADWIQISLVLLSCSATLAIWHIKWHAGTRSYISM